MSIFDSLLRLFDPIELRKKQEKRRRIRKAQPPGFGDDEELALPPSRPAPAEARLVCRVCGYQGGPAHRFCARCLAETMERRR